TPPDILARHGHAHRQGGSPLKAKVSTARHLPASAPVAVWMNGSDMIQYVPFTRWVSHHGELGNILDRDQHHQLTPLCVPARLRVNDGHAIRRHASHHRASGVRPTRAIGHNTRRSTDASTKAGSNLPIRS